MKMISPYSKQEFRQRWMKETLPFQMGNIGSEVYGALKYYGVNEARFVGAYERALELFDFTIEGLAAKGALREVCRAREEFCDYFDRNEYHTDPVRMQRYYDQFVMLGR